MRRRRLLPLEEGLIVSGSSFHVVVRESSVNQGCLGERHDSETSSTGRDDLDVSMSRDRIKPALVSRRDTREARETTVEMLGNLEGNSSLM